MRLPPIDFQTQLIDPSTGTPTQFLMLAWQILTELRLNDLNDVAITNPVNGQVLTYDGVQKKWIPS